MSPSAQILIGTRTYPPTKPNDPIIEGHLLTAARLGAFRGRRPAVSPGRFRLELGAEPEQRGFIAEGRGELDPDGQPLPGPGGPTSPDSRWHCHGARPVDALDVGGTMR